MSFSKFNLINVTVIVLGLLTFETTVAQSGYAEKQRKINELESEEAALLDKLDDIRDTSEELDKLSERWKRQTAALQVILEASLKESASCEKLELQAKQLTGLSEGARKDGQRNIDDCYRRLDRGIERFSDAEDIVNKIELEVGDLKAQGQINALNAEAINTSLKRVRAEYEFWRSELEDSKAPVSQ